MADLPTPGLWADPRLWIIAAVVMIVITIIMIYYKVFTGERSP